MVSPEVVSALYVAMLGHPPDEAGLEHWCGAVSVVAVIDALASTDRHRERCAALAAEGSGLQNGSDAARSAWRLEHGRGLAELADLPPGVAHHGALEVLPWDSVCAGIDGPEVRVVGRYARELCDELRRREPTADVAVGLDERPLQPDDVLVLTAGGDLDGVLWGRPQLVRQVRHRIVVPVQLAPSRPADEASALRLAARRRVHDAGFAQVSHLLRRSHGGGTLLVDVTRVAAAPGELQVEPGDSVPATLPSATWLVGDRTATESTR